LLGWVWVAGWLCWGGCLGGWLAGLGLMVWWQADWMGLGLVAG
jgi:hypothetical protein